MNGWMGTILRVNLSEGKIAKEPLGEEFAAKYIGGRGFNAKVLFDEVKPGIDPLGPDNKLILGVGPCNGTLVPGNSRLTITAKSPLSGSIGDSNCSALLSARLKYAGYDMVIIEGQARNPVYLWIDDDKVELRDAEQLWGKTTQATRMALERENGDPDISVISIGPAGENLVKFACIIADLGRAAGRTGTGAVMGSKKLKAVAVRGSKGVKVAHRKQLEEAAQEFRRGWSETEGARERYATFGVLGALRPWHDILGTLSTRNYQQGTFEKFESLSGEHWLQYFLKSKSCFSCPTPCDHIFIIDKGRFAGTWGSGVELDKPQMYGTNVGVSEPEFAIKAGALSDEYGLDVMEMSGVIAYTMQCFEEGILTTEDTDGLNIEWGNGDTILKLIEMTAYRHGVGDIFAEGVKRASERIGKGSEKYALHVKGLYPDAMDPRGQKAWGLGYAVSSRGAEHCHTLARADWGLPGSGLGFDPIQGEVLGQPDKMVDSAAEDGKAQMVKWYEEVRAFENCMEICSFATRYYPKESSLPKMLAKLFNAATGFNLSDKDVLHIGERIVNLERAFAAREGFTRKDDTLPTRFLTEPMPDGSAKGQVIHLEPMLDEYYRLRGWDIDSGLPTKEKLVELGLEEIADELEKTLKLT
ncbi:aldehyde ferredoxin oxidoreductase family protein [Chloroflexota bacterium]